MTRKAELDLDVLERELCSTIGNLDWDTWIDKCIAAAIKAAREPKSVIAAVGDKVLGRRSGNRLRIQFPTGVVTRLTTLDGRPIREVRPFRIVDTAGYYSVRALTREFLRLEDAEAACTMAARNIWPDYTGPASFVEDADD